MKIYSILLAALLVGTASAKEPTIAEDVTITGKDIIPACPEWVNHAVVYQIYPQTFYDSNGDGIGDLPGIIQKLNYIKSLGVDAIWINPFFDSPFNDAGYDIRDYYKIAPRYGSNDDARRLFAEAHKRGLKVLFDYVISYTSIDNPWFVASCEQKSGLHSNWYIWTDNVWKNEPGNQWVHGYGHRNGNFLSNFFWNEPAVNWGYGNPDPEKKWQLPTDHPDVLAMREEMKKVMRFWMNLGADGFRADMAGALVKGDDPRHETLGYWREVRQILNTNYPQAFIVSEWSGPRDALDGAFHADFYHWVEGFNDIYQKESWRIGNGMSDGHSFFDREGKGNIKNFLDGYYSAWQDTRSKGYICLPLGNHDIARLNNQRSVDDLEMIIAWGMTMPGVPFLYYGNEIGMRQLENLPQIEGCYKPRAGARTPMQWTPFRNLGFSTAKPFQLYLPVDPAPDAPNVAAEERKPDSLLNRVRKLIRLKHTEPALAAYAEFVPLYAKENTYPFVYARASGEETLLMIFNPAASATSAEFSFPVEYQKLKLLAGKEVHTAKAGQTLKIEVPGQTYAIYQAVK
jgi:maltose alpha-D-glucosyltransferase/alpha-amylase